MRSRTEFWEKNLDSRRNIDHECGYPLTITAQNYHDMYERFGPAARVVNLLPEEAWSSTPSVYESEDPEHVTPFEEAWESIASRLLGDSLYRGEEGNPVWRALRQFHVRSRIGQFGVLLLGINDGLPLSEPLAGVEERGSLPVRPERTVRRTEDGETEAHDYVPQPTLNQLAEAGIYSLAVNADAQREHYGSRGVPGLEYLRPFEQVQVHISRYENNLSSRRYGHPTSYQITFGDSQPVDWAEEEQPRNSVQVHWTRCIHLAEGDEVLGEPAMRSVFNFLMNLQKIYGADGESFWRNGILKLMFETHPQLGGDVRVDATEFRTEIEKMMNGLQQWMLLKGMSAKPIGPQVVDPTSHVNANIEAICIKLGVPKRIFVGSERGELASSQDEGTWNDRLRDYQNRFITPQIIVPFVDRLVMAGVLPQPEEYTVVWPDLAAMSESEKAEIAAKRTETFAKYIGGQVESLITPIHFLTREMYYTNDEAEEILEDAERAAAERAEEEAEEAAEQAEEEAMRQQQEMGEQPLPAPGQPPQEPKPGGGNPVDEQV